MVAGLESASLLDRAYRRFIHNRFFADGFGDLSKLDDLLKLKRQASTVARRPLRILSLKPTNPNRRATEPALWEGQFLSPVEEVAPGMLPPECRKVGFQLVVPAVRGDRAVVHLPATGDHTYWRRRLFMAGPLARRGITSVIPENPLYGSRKPALQQRSNLRCVLDLFIMGVACQFESIALLHWLEEEGYGTLAVNGLSMGGHMASMVAASWPKPVGLISCLGPFTASGVFTRGVLAECCQWDALGREAAKYAPGASVDPANANVIDVMKEVLDRATALQRFGTPVTTRATIVYAARHDAYVPPDDMAAFGHHWPGVDMRWIDSGHLGCFLFKNGMFLKGVLDSLDRLEEYHRETSMVGAQDGPQRILAS